MENKKYIVEGFSGIRATSEALRQLKMKEYNTYSIEFDKPKQDFANKLWKTEDPVRDITKFSTWEVVKDVSFKFKATPYVLRKLGAIYEGEKTETTDEHFNLLENGSLTRDNDKWAVKGVDGFVKSGDTLVFKYYKGDVLSFSESVYFSKQFAFNTVGDSKLISFKPTLLDEDGEEILNPLKSKMKVVEWKLKELRTNNRTTTLDPFKFNTDIVDGLLKESTKKHPQDLTSEDFEEKPTKENTLAFVGGFPCQPFSHTGKGNGFNDPRGKLFIDTLVSIGRLMPEWGILENVKGILRKDHSWIIDDISLCLRNWGYKTEVIQINSKDFGPQSRPRVYVYFSRVSTPTPSKEFTERILKKSEGEKQDLLDIVLFNYDDLFDESKFSLEERDKYLKLYVKDPIEFWTDKYSSQREVDLGHNYKNVIEAANKTYMGPQTYHIPKGFKPDTHKNRVYATDGTSRYYNINPESDNRAKHIGAVLKSSAPRVVENWFPSSVKYQDETNNGIIKDFGKYSKKEYEGWKMRTLSGYECMRLQGWEDRLIDRVKNESQIQLVKASGDSMTISVMKCIIENLNLK